MSKKKKIQETTIEDFYDLNIDKVDELVAALKGDVDEENLEPISMNIADCTGVDEPKNYTRGGKQKKFNPYKTDFLRNVPTVIKALFVKWWFYAAISFFVLMGLGNYLDDLDLAVVAGLVSGMIIDLFINPIYRFMESDEHEYNAYMMFPFPFKAFWTFFTNILYGFVITYGAGVIYSAINLICNNVSGTSGLIYLGTEPFLYGTFMLIVDMIFIGIKDGIVYIVKHLRKKGESSNV